MFLSYRLVARMVPTNQKPTVEERRERKKLQNRLNQRARRQRIKDQEDTDTKTQKNPFRIERWRLDSGLGLSMQTSRPLVLTSDTAANDRQALDHGTTQPLQPQTTRVRRIPSRALLSLEPEVVHDPGPSLPADHTLIHLITHNACRGLMHNRSVLRAMASYISAVQDPPLLPDFAIGCETVVLRPTHRTMPIDLLPTQLQMNSPHPTWMDALPFPEIRDNLIRRQYLFNHRHFLEDLVGDRVYLHPLPAQSQRGPVSTPSSQQYRQQDDSQSAQDGKGLILWGEPHLKENWEATAHFLIKWSWAVEGCRELVDIANKWRTTRGEHSLQIRPQSGQ
uniref:BZIP domain-containing protein n=1 Tax=Bionectria ochroleuca TaxID=29856 RepID=A0A0B7KSD8_BIOOC